MNPITLRPRQPIGQLRIDQVTFDEALDGVCTMVDAQAGGTVLTPNVDHVVQVEHDARLSAAYANASLSLVDGMPVLWAMRLLGRALPEKVSGSDLFGRLIARAAERGYSIYLLGAGPGVAEIAAKKLTRENPSLKIVGIDAAKVDLERDDPMHPEIVARIRASKAAIVFVAFGCPKQEIVMDRIAAAVAPAVLVGVGASFDFVAGTIPRAPQWMSRSGLEWLYRLVREPARLGPRYLARDPQFLAILLRELSKRSTSKRPTP
jgi:N-acetylglucosaminyldiphosphoundecaprenol N-acetyl-beta-D-mannosaminyltransferase